jgi:hypothetical protein
VIQTVLVRMQQSHSDRLGMKNICSAQTAHFIMGSSKLKSRKANLRNPLSVVNFETRNQEKRRPPKGASLGTSQGQRTWSERDQEVGGRNRGERVIIVAPKLRCPAAQVGRDIAP